MLAHIIRQGRCTLVATVQMYKILAPNCVISAYALSVQYLGGINYGDYQDTITGILMSVCLCISRAKVGSSKHDNCILYLLITVPAGREVVPRTSIREYLRFLCLPLHSSLACCTHRLRGLHRKPFQGKRTVRTFHCNMSDS